MEFLDKSVLPQSAHHMVLLKYLIVVAFVILIPYLSLLLGNLIYSVYFRRKAIKEKNEFFYRLSEDIIDMITFNRSVAFAFGIIPFLSAMFGFAQLLNHTNASVEYYLFAAALLLFNAQLLIYSYKKGFLFKFSHEEIISKDFTDEELRRLEKSKKAVRLFGKSGIYGLILLLLSIYVFCFAVQFASDSSQWENINSIWGIIFSLNSIILFVQFILSAILISSSMVLYRFFRNNSELDNYSAEQKNIVRDFVLKKGLFVSIILPLFVVLSVIMRSKFSLSFGVFGYTVLALCLILFVSSLFYIMIKESDARYNTSVLYLMIVIVFVLVIRDQYSFDVSTKKQFALLAADYDVYEAKVKEQLGIGEAPISGLDIYNGRCIACHNFDKKIVGPPYNSTLPKYEGKKDQLVKFILNPVKVNPDYPAMSNQGLKPKEAEAIAEYLLNTYKKNP